MDEKISKAKANYREGTPKEHCSICTMWRGPHSCTAVSGVIYAADTCDLFEKREALKGS
jgi:hypothetical protein